MNLEQAREAIGRLGEGRASPPGSVRLSTAGAIARLELDNPRARNALTLRMMSELLEAVVALRAWDGAALILCAKGPVFCSGGHLGEVQAAIRDREAATAMSLAMTAVLDGLLALPLISVAALGGSAIGGGAEVATATDFRVATGAARVHFVHGRLGIAPGWGGTGRLVGHVGARAALGVLTRAEPLGAEEALAVGLVDAVVEDPIRGAEAFLEPMLQVIPQATRALKAQVTAARSADRALEAEAFAGVWGSPAHRAALDAVYKRRS